MADSTQIHENRQYHQDANLWRGVHKKKCNLKYRLKGSRHALRVAHKFKTFQQIVRLQTGFL